jgi:RNA polymerase sigma factor (sigma-70 family)
VLLSQIWQERLYIFKSIAYAVLADASVVEDVLQETFKKVLQSKHSFTDRQEAFNYLRRAVINTSIDAFRKKQRFCRRFESKGNLSDYPSRTEEGQGDPLNFLIREETNRHRQELLTEIQDAITRLTATQKEALTIFFGRQSNRNVKQLCRCKGLPYSTVRSRMLKAVENIRKQLHSKGVPGFEDDQ